MKKLIFKVTILVARLLGMEGLVKIYIGGLREDGWFLSFKLKQAVRKDLKPIPWYTYPAIKFIEGRLKSSMKVYEFGCGNSTLWYSQRVNWVDSVEHDKEWYDYIINSMPKNVSINQSYKDYVDDIDSRGCKYDLIVIDGLNRGLCARKAVLNLTKNGVIILDNSDKQKHKSAVDFLDNTGLKRIDFFGLAPMCARNVCTTIYYPQDNILDI
jgi:hypothetical protein